LRFPARLIPALCALACLVVSLPLEARVKLAALPERERVELRLDHGHYTLVEEERIVPLLASNAKNGNNRVDFSWSNTSIDKDSILFRPLAIRENGKFRAIESEEGRSEVEVVNVSYPPGENAVVWEVYSKKAAAVQVRVSYLIHNLGRSFSYRAQANAGETELSLAAYLHLTNYSGEDFENAAVSAGFGPDFKKDVENQNRIRMLLERFPKVPIRKTFTFDWYSNGPLNANEPFASPIALHYVLENDKDSGLGAFPLQPGKARIFVADGRGGEAFIGEDIAPLTPLDGTAKLFLGQSRDVVCRRTIEKNDRRVIRGNLFDQEIVIKYEIENFRDKPCTLDILEQLNRVAAQYARPAQGDVEWKLGATTSEALRITYPEGQATPKLSVDLPARRRGEDADSQKLVVRFHFTLKNLW